MKVKVIGCQIFQYLAEQIGMLDYDVNFLSIAQHDQPALLKQTLQNEINASQDYDLILLLYGLCGNAVAGLKSERVPLRVFRIHDCSSLFLNDANQVINQRWSCYELWKNHMDWGNNEQEWLERYGEHAQYLREILCGNNEIAYLTFHRKEDEEAKQGLIQEGKKIIKEYEGNKEALEAMLRQQKHPLILSLQPQEEIVAMIDHSILKVKSSIQRK